MEIPATIRVIELPSAMDARDKLLAAIGQEAQHVADKYAGQASAALGELARAYAVVAAGPTTAPTTGAAIRTLALADPSYTSQITR